ncbi:uncharacterized protein LOC124171414 isoform X2 [Ischnura elegans]|uniref:uncharacterized protein LOC124171414 isoform X2 n=1 Tax=Ischnura elegans TaxID=197161 RepID=UPI001ED89CA1|nr:uncharacterized protein LOC124171414 isoform X2 [Ischnura elegans]
MLATRSQPSVGRELNGGGEGREGGGGGEGVVSAADEVGVEDAVPTMGIHEAPGGGEADSDGSYGQPLKPGWTAHVTTDGRVFYCNHMTRVTSWIPPVENWPWKRRGGSGGTCKGSGRQAPLPFGWEEAIDHQGKSYFINHVNKTTTYEDPRRLRGRIKRTKVEDGSVVGDGKGGRLRGGGGEGEKDGGEEDTEEVLEDDEDDEAAPSPRVVTLTRHPELGFGFVAGSEKPVIVRFVTEGGPSDGKLQPGDQILSIGGQEVREAPREYVIQLVRSSRHTVTLCVCQPPLDNSTRKSALLSAAKKARLRSHPPRVRFAEGVVVNGAPLFPPSAFSMGDTGVWGGGQRVPGVPAPPSQGPSAGPRNGAREVMPQLAVPFLPNVLKVFLENGQTKSFKYDACTRVADVAASLVQKLGLVPGPPPTGSEHMFSLVVEHVKGLRRNKLTLLHPEESIARIAARPGSHNLRCLFRVAFVPRDASVLAQSDPLAFDYLYMQCCNDVVQERFAPELKYEVALHLAALHIHQHALSHNLATPKVSLKTIEREFGLERFVPVSLVETMKRKELRKLIGHFLKGGGQTGNGTRAPLSQTVTTPLQAKLLYLSTIAELPSYGAKCFPTNLQDSNMETVVLVSPKFGISQIVGVRNSVPVPLAPLEQMGHVTVSREDEISRRVAITLPGSADQKELVLSLEERDAEELVLVLQGYFKSLTGQELPLSINLLRLSNNTTNSAKERANQAWLREDLAPPYHTQHHVRPSSWSYVSGAASTTHMVNFAALPPYQPLAGPNAIDIGLGKPNGHIPGSDIYSSINGTALPLYPDPSKSNGSAINLHLDNNMNNMSGHEKERNGSIDSKEGSHHRDANRNVCDGEARTRRAVELLERDTALLEARNKEVIRRVAEMQALVENSERYLLAEQGEGCCDGDCCMEAPCQGPCCVPVPQPVPPGPWEEGESDSESSLVSSSSENGGQSNKPGWNHNKSEMGQLKHSDSLLLLTQGQKQINADELSEAVRSMELTGGGGQGKDGNSQEINTNMYGTSESDTDSMSTPTNSPSRRPGNAGTANSTGMTPNGTHIKQSDSSFGLHSPDTLMPLGSRPTDHELQELLKRLQEDKCLPYDFAEGTLYLDPDIIDLTMIPPPITPDEDGFGMVEYRNGPQPPSSPPTPFADRSSFEGEILRRQSNGISTGYWNHWPTSNGIGQWPIADNQDIYGNGISDIPWAAVNGTGSEEYEAMEDDKVEEDLEWFIARSTMPPPPGSGDANGLGGGGGSAVEELTPEEILSYIIPPPPPSPPASSLASPSSTPTSSLSSPSFSNGGGGTRRDSEGPSHCDSRLCHPGGRRNAEGEGTKREDGGVEGRGVAPKAEEEDGEDEEEDQGVGTEEEEGGEGTSLYCCGKGKRKKRQQASDLPSSPLLSRTSSGSREDKERPSRPQASKKEETHSVSSPKKPVPSPRQSPYVSESSSSVVKEKTVLAGDNPVSDDTFKSSSCVGHLKTQDKTAEAICDITAGSSPVKGPYHADQSSRENSHLAEVASSPKKNLTPNSSPLLSKVLTPSSIRKADGYTSHIQHEPVPLEPRQRLPSNSSQIVQKLVSKIEASLENEESGTSHSPTKAPIIRSEEMSDLRQVALNRHKLQACSSLRQLQAGEPEVDQPPLLKPVTKRGGPDSGIPDCEVLSGAWTELCGLLVRLEACSPGAVRGGPHSADFDAVDAGGGLGRMALEARRLVTESKMLIRAATFAIGGGQAHSPLGKHIWPGVASPVSSPTGLHPPTVLAPSGQPQQLADAVELLSSLDLHLNQCLLLLNRLTQLCEASSSGPGWQVARKIADVTVAFGEAVRVVACWVGGSSETGDTAAIECAAESLAGALASLLRSLRVVPR